MRGLVARLSCITLLLSSPLAHADKPPPGPVGSADKSPPPAPWCAPELEVLPGDVCFFANPKATKPGQPRTLVVFLHGWVKLGLDWQHAQQRGIVRGAKRLGFSVLTPRGRAGASSRGGKDIISWPTSRGAQQRYEKEVLKEWRDAKQMIEERNGEPFDEVFVVGFSNGAYYSSSLAMRGELAVNGYAMFAGGSAYQPQAKGARRQPLFLGICSRDGTAKTARKFRKQLRKVAWPHKAETRKVGHTMADAHLNHALSYLRKEAAKRRARQAAKKKRAAKNNTEK